MLSGTKLTFVNVEDPNNAVTAALRRRIRSRAAIHTHESRFKTLASTSGPTATKEGFSYNIFALKDGVKSVRQRRRATKEKGSKGKVKAEEEEEDEKSETDIITTTEEAANEALPPQLPTTFASSPVPYRPWFAETISIWRYKIMPVLFIATDLEILTGVKYTEHNDWLWKISLNDPAMYYLQLLAATALLQRYTHPSRLLWLQYAVTRALNETLKNPNTRTSAVTIVTVGLIAFHEALYGNHEVATKVHVPAMRRMLEIRGGLSELTEEIPMCAVTIMWWHDQAVARITGGEPAWCEKGCAGIGHPGVQMGRALRDFVGDDHFPT